MVAKDVTDFRDGDISVRFEGISGRIDQGAGILFNLKPNGDYLTVRANPLENNLVLWKFEKGKRSSVKWIRNTPTPTRQWHDLKVHIAGPKGTIDEGVDMRFTDFGKSVAIELPPADQIVPFSDVPDLFKQMSGG